MSAEEGGSPTIDPEAVRGVLEDYPVTLGVLFGSTVQGTETTESDVDVAVAFKESLPAEDRHRAWIDLIVDLMESLGVNDVDVVDLERVRPSVGASALRTGVVLLGDEEQADRLCEAFESRTTERTHQERMEEFDEILDRLEDAA